MSRSQATPRVRRSQGGLACLGGAEPGRGLAWPCGGGLQGEPLQGMFEATPYGCAIRQRGMTNQRRKQGEDGGLALQEAKPRLKRPPMFKVILLNDDYTPMEFVVQVLERFFAMNRQKATQIMLHVHMRGMGVCGVFTRDIAETKMHMVNEYSRANQHPLLCTIEEA